MTFDWATTTRGDCSDLGRITFGNNAVWDMTIFQVYAALFGCYVLIKMALHWHSGRHGLNTWKSSISWLGGTLNHRTVFWRNILIQTQILAVRVTNMANEYVRRRYRLIKSSMVHFLISRNEAMWKDPCQPSVSLSAKPKFGNLYYFIELRHIIYLPCATPSSVISILFEKIWGICMQSENCR